MVVMDEFKVIDNPRYVNAPYERKYFVHNPSTGAIRSNTIDLTTGFIKDKWPFRYDTVEEAEIEGNKGIPPFIKVFPDGREEESF